MTEEAMRIDGSIGEGGGQILRTALAVAALTGRPLEIVKIREKRPIPGLAAQHLTAVRALAALCDARLEGAELGSRELRFAPSGPVRAGSYAIDVGAARAGGSAGAVSLVLQAVAVPLALARGPSELRLTGGTHVPWSPPFDYLAEVWAPMLARLGLAIGLELEVSGWFPVGKGCVRARIEGRGGRPLEPLEASLRPALLRIEGRALAANLPAEIPQRISDRARKLLEPLGVPLVIRPERVRAASPGAALCLVAHHDGWRAGFDSLGAPGKASEVVAEEAAQALLAFERGSAVVDRHLADQLLLPLAFASGPSTFSAEAVTGHLETCAWLLDALGVARIALERREDGSALVRVEPAGVPVPLAEPRAEPLSLPPSEPAAAEEERARARRPSGERFRAPGRMPETVPWNLVATVHAEGWREALGILGRYGKVHKTPYYNVLVMAVDDPRAVAEDLAARIAAEPGILNFLSRLVPLEDAFELGPLEGAADRLFAALAPMVPRLAGRSFHVRVHKRGPGKALSGHELERRLDERLLAELEARGTPGRIAFDDVDVVLVVEIVDERAGVAAFDRGERERFPFLRLD
ncbi:MAG: RNA 3'-terminal phosphate cyclase [Geminicoccaceae bacterium]|nr:RNA 3'-terminal phosphate cyclase [Geminicoccaceae bacterium]MDW8123486.1 RNA 3'-terminal phosphate cyclase [Geminicoccaceae bacterium]